MPVHGLTITVAQGQSLGRIAETYHVPKRVIIAANQLQPPYELKAGSRLVILGLTNTAAATSHHKAREHASTPHPTKAKSPPAGEPEVIPLD
jgi:LysM repeat protein